MAIYLKHRNKYGCSAEDMNELIALHRSTACPGSNIPADIDEMEKLTSDLTVKHKEHLVCRCEKFRFDHERTCIFCGGPRENAKKYYTIPIAPRLQQLKEVSAFAKVLSRLRTHQPTRFIDDLHSSPAWVSFEEEVGKEAIALSYCSDGFNPFHHNITQGTYSIWAQSGLLLNLPPQLRMKKETTMLFGLIPGPHSPKSLNIYNEVLVRELLELEKGVPAFNSFTQKSTTLRARILYTVCDVPGNAKEQNRVQQNAKASCCHCCMKGIHSKILDKTVYPGGRIFLPLDHPFRHDVSFPTRSVEESVVINRTKHHEMTTATLCDRLEHEIRNEGKNNKARLQSIAQEHGRYGSCEWFRLPYLDMQEKHSPVEPMHAVKVVAEHITKMVNGDEDGPKVRAQERSMNRFVHCCPDQIYNIYVKEKKTLGQRNKKRRRDPSEGENEGDDSVDLETRYPKGKLPPAPFTLNNTEKKIADDRLSKLRFPPNFGDIPNTLFTKICGGIKTHTWHQLFTSGALRYCLRGLLGEEQRVSLCNFLKGLETLFQSPVEIANIDSMEENWHVVLCQLERDFPLAIQSYVMHLLHHLPKYIRHFGSPSNFWMFPYERFNKTLSEAITNSKNPELNAIKKMEMQWLLTLLESSGFLEPLRSRPVPRNDYQHLTFLHAGQFQPKPRQATQQEEEALKQLYKTPLLEDNNITVFHYARKAGSSSTTMYRDVVVEQSNSQYSASVVSCHFPTGQFVGVIQYFFCHQLQDRNELAFINWVGQPELCQQSMCSKVIRTEFQPPPVIWVSQLSQPLIYAWEDDHLWLPTI